MMNPKKILHFLIAGDNEKTIPVDGYHIRELVYGFVHQHPKYSNVYQSNLPYEDLIARKEHVEGKHKTSHHKHFKKGNQPAR